MTPPIHSIVVVVSPMTLPAQLALKPPRLRPGTLPEHGRDRRALQPSPCQGHLQGVAMENTDPGERQGEETKSDRGGCA